jgi:hypothetical protein
VKPFIVIRSALFFSQALLAAACCGRASADEKPFTVDANLTYSSLYMSDGFKIGGDHPVWQPSIAMTTPLEGVSVAVWSSLQIDRDNQQYDELDLMIPYAHDFMRNTPYAFNLHGFYDYWTYPKINVVPEMSDGSNPTENMHGNKLHAGVSMTNLIPIEGSHLVPTYNLYYWLYWAQNQRDQFQGGAHHEFQLSYFHDVPRFLPGARFQYVGASGSINYNDGAFNVRPGWSHSVAQISTGVYGEGWMFSCSLNRQWSYRASVDPNNELWSMVSFSKQF